MNGVRARARVLAGEPSAGSGLERDAKSNASPGCGEEPVLTRPIAAKPRKLQSQSERCGGIEGRDESFTACLNRNLRASGLSLSALGRRSWLDISYVSRLVNLPCDPLNVRLGDSSDRRHPSRDTVIRLGLAMQLSMERMDELLLSAGYAPLVR